MAVGGADPARCPRCGHAHVASRGRDRDGGRRRLCRGCGRTFSAKTDGVLAPFSGVSTRRLPHYLAWFCWEEQARRSDATRLGMLVPQVANGTTNLRIRAMWDEPQPFFDEYWGGRVWADEVDLNDLYEPEFVLAVV